MTLRRPRSRPAGIIAIVASTATVTSLSALAGIPASDASVQPAARTAAATTSQTTGHAEGEGARERLPNFDVRTASSTALDRARTRVLADRGKAIDRLGTTLGPSGLVSVDAVTGTPSNVSSTEGFLTGPSRAAAATIAIGYVRSHSDLFGLDAADVATLSAPKVATDAHGIRHISWTQSYRGVQVFGNGLRAHVAKNGSLIAVQGAPVADLAARAAKAPAATLSASTARAAALTKTGATAEDATARTSGATTTWSNGDVAQKVYFATAGGLREAWSTYTRANAKASYQQVLDGRTGALLYRHNTVSQDRGDGLVYNNYPGAAKGGRHTKIDLYKTRYLPRHTGWLKGRYVYAWADINDNDRPDTFEKTPVPGNRKGAQFRLTQFRHASSLCSSTNQCTWNPNKAYSWKVNKKQDVTQGFILASRFHDYLKHGPIGFTAKMGNFEKAGGDAVRLQVLDGANTTGDGFPDGNHIDNANMSTPPDGMPPTMQMYLNHFPGTNAKQDPYLPASSADSADNIYHEYTHGLSNRLVVDADGNSTLNSLHAGAMGEAWSDYYAEDFLVTRGLVANSRRDGEVLFDSYLTNNRPITRSEAIDCSVGARAPLCRKYTNGARGGYTFGDLGHATGGPEVHADGEIWSQTLWDLRAALGHRITAAVVTEAMSLSPADPSFLDERDAILTADQAIYRGAHKSAIWRVFAARGMGWFASATDGSDADVVEDFHTRPGPGAPRRTITGQVTDDATGDPIEGAYVRIPGHSSAVSNYTDRTDADGRYEIDDILAGRYPEIVATAPGYEVASKVANVLVLDKQIDFTLRRDWAAREGGASLDSFSGVDYSDFGCGPAQAIDLSYGTGWGSNRGPGSNDNPVDTSTPKYIVVKLPQPIDVSSFGVDPTSTCGDAGSASTGPYRIEVSTDGNTFTEVATGTFTPADRGRVNQVPPTGAAAQDVAYVKFWIDDSQVEQLRNPQDLCSEGAAYDGCQYMDLTELEVFGTPVP